jgi:hypothetical protein
MDAADFNPAWQLTIAGKPGEQPPDGPNWEARMSHPAAA